MANNFQLMGISNNQYEFKELSTGMIYWALVHDIAEGQSEVTMLDGDLVVIPDGNHMYECYNIRERRVMRSNLRKGELP